MVRNRKPPRFLEWVCCAALLELTACGDRTTTAAEFAPEYTRQPHGSVSVLGVYRDGRMDEGAWDALAPAMSSALRTSRCDAAYGGVWTRSNSSFPGQVDDAVQARGLSDDWLDQVAQAGQGELLLVVAELSTPAAEPDPASSHSSYSPQGSSPRVGNAGSALALLSLMAIAMLSNSLVIDAAPTPRASQDMIAILFSRRVHRPVAATRLHYVGGSLPDARRLFAQQLATAMPGLTCAGWAAAAPTVKPESEE